MFGVRVDPLNFIYLFHDKKHTWISINYCPLMLAPLCLAWPIGEGHGLAFVWREFNPSPTRSCITEAKAYRLKQFQ